MKKFGSAILAAFVAALSVGEYMPPAPAANAASFTHMEYTGKNGNEDVFAVNREPASVNPIPYQSSEAAQKAVWDYNSREDSDYLQMLTGKGQDWQLTVVQNAEKSQGFFGNGWLERYYNTNPADGWKTVQLPDSWTCQGFDFPIYSNIREPFQSKYDMYVSAPNAPTNYNPVGLYRKIFTPDKSILESGRRVYIQFDGVESAYYVYINGKQVGYSEDTFSPHRFDVTDYLVDGENTLAVEVHKFCDGTWFEDQDMIYDGGIFRDVFLVSAPDSQIADYTVRTDLDDTFTNAQLDVYCDVKNASYGWTVEADVFDESGKAIVKGASAKVSADGTHISTKVIAPKLWSAEHPNLYALVLTLKDGSGNVREILSTQLGFREIGFTRAEVDWNYKVTTKNWSPMTINGKKLLFKGVNRHDTDPFHGKACTQEAMYEDIRLMQNNNINAIRTSHYSNDSYLYWLCNKYGMYVMGETNMESHALMDDNDSKALFYELAMDRTETAYKRLKNNPSIVAWSIGNEMAYTGDPNAAGGMFRDMIWYFKKNDPTRPVHSEGQGDAMGVDMKSNMYPYSQWLGQNAGVGKMPYVMCEYVHAMGNSVGALKEYWDVVRSSDNMLGGFIWDWADQSRAVDLSKVGGGWDYYSESYAHKNLYQEESKGKYFAYGGDWGDNPNDNSFCENGIVSPDRTAQPELAEVRYQYQNFWFSATQDQLANHEIGVYNESSFSDLNEYNIEWSVLKNGIAVQNGVIDNASVAPLSKGTVAVPFKTPAGGLSGDEYYLDISVKSKKDNRTIPAGTEISYWQTPLSGQGSNSKYDHGSDEVNITEQNGAYITVGKNFNFSISKSSGLMSKYSYEGDLLISEGPKPNFWRGNVENDTGWGANGSFDKAWQKAMDGAKAEKIDISDGPNGSKIIVSHISLPSVKSTIDIKYTIYSDGKIKVDMDFDPTKSGLGNLIRVGSMLKLPEGSEQVTWYGDGPVETFNDRKTNGRMGVWSDTVSHMFYPYMKADDTGTMQDVKWVSVKNEKFSNSLLIASEGGFEMSALHFTPQDLQGADHPFKLRPRNETYLSVNYGSMGTGSATCGQATLQKYRMPSNRKYSWSYTIMPVPSDITEQELANTTAKFRSDGTSIQDKSQNNIVVPVTSSASLKSTSNGNCVSGDVSIPANSAIDKSLSGNNSFTVEANIVPTGNPQFNMIASKGDHAFGLRTENNTLYFFIHAGGAWRSVSCERTTDAASGWIGKMHQIAGIYDAENNMIRIYCDGKMMAEKATGTTGGVTTSGYNLTLGKCPETNRGSAAEFYEFRVYSKALTAAELASQNTASPAYGPDSKDVQLWLDFDNIAENTIEDDNPEAKLIGDANDDNDVTVADAVAILQYIGNKDKYKLTDDGKVNADCYNPGDGITAKDALAIQKLDAGILEKLPEIDE